MTDTITQSNEHVHVAHNYNAIAKVIRETEQELHDLDGKESTDLKFLVLNFVERFKAKDPDFNAELFIERCGIDFVPKVEDRWVAKHVALADKVGA